MPRKTPRSVLSKILKRSPTSLRKLADAAGVSHVTLLKVRDGEFELSRDVADRIVRALRAWGELYADLADELESTVHDRGARK